jgi:hypothetical protein
MAGPAFSSFFTLKAKKIAIATMEMEMTDKASFFIGISSFIGSWRGLFSIGHGGYEWGQCALQTVCKW